MKRILDENEMNTVIARAYELRQLHPLRLGQAIVVVMRGRGWDFDNAELFYMEKETAVDYFIISCGLKEYTYESRES